MGVAVIDKSLIRDARDALDAAATARRLRGYVYSYYNSDSRRTDSNTGVPSRRRSRCVTLRRMRLEYKPT